jgi:hypothetical protein
VCVATQDSAWYDVDTPIIIGSPLTLKAIGYYYPHVGAPRVSAISSVTYAFAAAAPTMAPSSGTYTTAQTVTLATVTDGGTIRYTTDGSPTRTSTI